MKPLIPELQAENEKDAPSRGHDLKLFPRSIRGIHTRMPPHGGMT